MLWFESTPAQCPAHALTHTLTLTIPTFRGKSTTARPTFCHPWPPHWDAQVPRLLWAWHGSLRAALSSCPARQGTSQHLSSLRRAVAHLPARRDPCSGCPASPAPASWGKHGSFPDGPPLAGGQASCPTRWSYQQEDSWQRSRHRAHSNRLCLLVWCWVERRRDRTGGCRGTGGHSPTRMRTHTSSAMRAPGLSVADTT